MRDISPFRALRALQKLTITDLLVTDLTQIAGMKLTYLNLQYCSGLWDLTPLAGMPLEELWLWSWSGTDLRPLAGMPLRILNCCGKGQKMDLAPLAGHQLEKLYI